MCVGVNVFVSDRMYRVSLFASILVLFVSGSNFLLP